MYQYEIERPWLFTEEGSLRFLRARDGVLKLLDRGGKGSFIAVTPLASSILIDGVPIDVQKMLAICDRMVEIGDLVEVKNTERTVGQDRIFARSR
jgi:hypothetical protein